MHYATSLEGIGAEDLRGGFFEGWAAPPTPEEHLQLLLGSSHVVVACEDGRVLGFVNALSDGVLCAYIPLLEVLRAYRGQGIGTELVRRLLAVIGPRYMIDVMCDAEVLPFYERLGFGAATGGIIRNRSWRSPEAGTHV